MEDRTKPRVSELTDIKKAATSELTTKTYQSSSSVAVEMSESLQYILRCTFLNAAVRDGGARRFCSHTAPRAGMGRTQTLPASFKEKT